VITDTREIFDAATPDQDNRVLLEVMTFTGNVSPGLNAVGKTDTSNLPLGGVWLLGGSGCYLNTHTAFLGTIKSHRTFTVGIKGRLEHRRVESPLFGDAWFSQ
jgi:hypothetical protein